MALSKVEIVTSNWNIKRSHIKSPGIQIVFFEIYQYHTHPSLPNTSSEGVLGKFLGSW